MLAAKRMHRTYPGYGHWALFEGSFAILFFLQTVRDFFPDFIPVVFGNFSACVAMIALAEGNDLFEGRRRRRIPVYVFSAVFLAILYYYFLFAEQDLRARAIASSFYLSAMSAYAVLPLWRRAPQGRKFGYRFTKSVLLFGFFIGMVRIVFLICAKAANTLYTGRLFDSAYFLCDLLYLVGITFSFFLLTHERAMAELSEEVEERKKLTKQLNELTITDELTGVLNRRGFLEALKREALRSSRLQHTFSVLELDLDHFKEINDRYGHTIGDKALGELMDTCRSRLRAVDTLGRLGGDEFAVILPETSAEDALLVSEKLCAAVAEAEVSIGGSESFPMTVSIGAAEWDDGDAAGQEALANADQALYMAKQSGRNCFRLAPPVSSEGQLQ